MTPSSLPLSPSPSSSPSPPPPPTTEDDLTIEYFTNLFRSKYGLGSSKSSSSPSSSLPSIESIHLTREERGVLSTVLKVELIFTTPTTATTVVSSTTTCDDDNDGSTTAADDDARNSVVVVDNDVFPPSHWIVKLVRNDLNLSWMCRNEYLFYSVYAPNLFGSLSTATTSSSSNLPFTIPTYLDGSDQHLILEQIQNVDTSIVLADGCSNNDNDNTTTNTNNRFDTLLECLAALHATCWVSNNNKDDDDGDNDHTKSDVWSSLSSTLSNNDDNDDVSLVFPVGMGQKLPALQKEGLFVRSWQDTLRHMTMSDDDDHKLHGTSSSSKFSSSSSFIWKFCQRLSNIRLRDIHHMVHQHRLTLVHGDYHIANWLFPIDDNDDDGNSNDDNSNDDHQKQQQQQPQQQQHDRKKPYLVDWATAGLGNPMVDLVFFLVVSTNDDSASNPKQVLQQYYSQLIKYNPNLTKANNDDNGDDNDDSDADHGQDGGRISANITTIDTLQQYMMFALLCQWLILVSYDAMCRQLAQNEPTEAKREMTSRHFNNVNRRTILAIQGFDDQEWDEVCFSKLPLVTDKEKQEAQKFCDEHPLTI